MKKVLRWFTSVQAPIELQDHLPDGFLSTRSASSLASVRSLSTYQAVHTVEAVEQIDPFLIVPWETLRDGQSHCLDIGITQSHSAVVDADLVP